MLGIRFWPESLRIAFLIHPEHERSFVLAKKQVNVMKKDGEIQPTGDEMKDEKKRRSKEKDAEKRAQRQNFEGVRYS